MVSAGPLRSRHLELRVGRNTHVRPRSQLPLLLLDLQIHGLEHISNLRPQGPFGCCCKFLKRTVAGPPKHLLRKTVPKRFLRCLFGRVLVMFVSSAAPRWISLPGWRSRNAWLLFEVRWSTQGVFGFREDHPQHRTEILVRPRARPRCCGTTKHPREQKPPYLIATSGMLIACFMGR